MPANQTTEIFPHSNTPPPDRVYFDGQREPLPGLCVGYCVDWANKVFDNNLNTASSDYEWAQSRPDWSNALRYSIEAAQVHEAIKQAGAGLTSYDTIRGAFDAGSLKASRKLGHESAQHAIDNLADDATPSGKLYFLNLEHEDHGETGHAVAVFKAAPNDYVLFDADNFCRRLNRRDFINDTEYLTSSYNAPAMTFMLKSPLRLSQNVDHTQTFSSTVPSSSAFNPGDDTAYGSPPYSQQAYANFPPEPPGRYHQGPSRLSLPPSSGPQNVGGSYASNVSPAGHAPPPTGTVYPNSPYVHGLNSGYMQPNPGTGHPVPLYGPPPFGGAPYPYQPHSQWAAGPQAPHSGVTHALQFFGPPRNYQGQQSHSNQFTGQGTNKNNVTKGPKRT